MTDVYVINPIIPAAPGTKLLREGKAPLPIVAWRVVEKQWAMPIAARAPNGYTIMVPGPDGEGTSISTPQDAT